ncbi:DUF4411 family protein [Pseudomonas simiae]|jgi:hypothetical protein|uniref:DUF4411 domain-containing protein n=1 Tax=Pseudomonas simiae TaxID=321846 RepID=U1UTY0_9PSED|nr:DUF4411 family protein [Pseudomonas simiae]ERH58557.1 hypothetical protein O204_04030 [Pseudomonas simiae]QQD28395.1 DUF4411 family protein [Pseudomonas simiae]WLG34812.1 DUF4411 family protein [Pseudomonas simiae]WLI24769.1 DUF4411 family protein [Pseudomonas simiae]
MKYLLDSNTLIEAKNRYYAMTVCPGYWAWILQQHQALEIASIVPVRDELARGNDDLTQWVKNNTHLFEDASDEPTQTAFGQIVAKISQQVPVMKVGAFDEFLEGADPWLIAKAMSTGAAVVTHEVYNPDIKRKFTIPNVCSLFGVPYMNTFELLGKLDARFVLHQ